MGALSRSPPSQQRPSSRSPSVPSAGNSASFSVDTVSRPPAMHGARRRVPLVFSPTSPTARNGSRLKDTTVSLFLITIQAESARTNSASPSLLALTGKLNLCASLHLSLILHTSDLVENAGEADQATARECCRIVSQTCRIISSMNLYCFFAYYLLI